MILDLGLTISELFAHSLLKVSTQNPKSGNLKSEMQPCPTFAPLLLHMESATEPVYVIPAKYRRMENMHIVFWLVKDISWCLIWEPLGIAMIVPTLAIAIIIAWRTRHIKSELAHNLAILFWISANSFWMISEFLEFDSTPILFGITGKHMALIPFAFGALILAWYYLVQKPREDRVEQVATM